MSPQYDFKITSHFFCETVLRQIFHDRVLIFYDVLNYTCLRIFYNNIL